MIVNVKHQGRDVVTEVEVIRGENQFMVLWAVFKDDGSDMSESLLDDFAECHYDEIYSEIVAGYELMTIYAMC